MWRLLIKKTWSLTYSRRTWSSICKLSDLGRTQRWETPSVWLFAHVFRRRRRNWIFLFRYDLIGRYQLRGYQDHKCRKNRTRQYRETKMTLVRLSWRLNTQINHSCRHSTPNPGKINLTDPLSSETSILDIVNQLKHRTKHYRTKVYQLLRGSNTADKDLTLNRIILTISTRSYNSNQSIFRKLERRSKLSRVRLKFCKKIKTGDEITFIQLNIRNVLNII